MELSKLPRIYLKEYKWNDLVYKPNSYTDPSTNIEYDLSHMKEMTTPLKYEYKNNNGDKEKGDVDVNVVFSPHCYTSELQAEDPRPVLVTDIYSDGSEKKRVFDLKRYEYSKRLVFVIKAISHKLCKESAVKGKALRLEDPDKKNPKKGVYILFKVRESKGTVKMYVETAHERRNEPYGFHAKNHAKKYMLILGDIIKSLNDKAST